MTIEVYSASAFSREGAGGSYDKQMEVSITTDGRQAISAKKRPG